MKKIIVALLGTIILSSFSVVANSTTIDINVIEKSSGNINYSSDVRLTQLGWLHKNNNYYFYENGDLARGLRRIGGKEYYFDDETGAMLSNGWKNVYESIDWYYIFPNGEVKMGWHWENGYYYYLGYGGMIDGMKTPIDGKYYSFDSSGHMQIGWHLDPYNHDSWQYSRPNGEMYIEEWLYDNEKWYYFDFYGEIVTEGQYIDGVWYDFNSSGVMQ